MIKADTVLDILSFQVSTTPGSLALKFGETELSYKQFDECSNQVANALISKGVTPGMLVPVSLHNPADMVIGIWGILKTGAAYVPIDPDFPADRISYMLADTGAGVVLSDSASTIFIKAAQDKVIVTADDNWAAIQDFPAAYPAVKVADDQLAYVIYTSGSTGQPKGVLIEHRSLLNYLTGLTTRLPYHTLTTFALVGTLAADIIITNLFGSFMVGGALHLFNKDNLNDIEYIHRYFNEHSIDCIKITPSHWQSLTFKGKELLPRKLLMFGGEALYTSVIREVMADPARTCMLVNHYGPTETTVGQLLHVVDKNDHYDHIIPLGKPFTGASVYIFDKTGNKVKNGQTGEIYIGGNCVARGYLNRLDLTEQRFIKDSFNTDNNDRFYRTGDLARQLQNGDIEYAGRIDDQVKIRGYRIELGEIESVLQKAPGVKQGVVLAKENSNGDKRLVAYVVSTNGYDKWAIVNFLEQKLPAYMVPQILVSLAELPFLRNGKVDKKALPDPDVSTLLTNAYRAPANHTETLIANIWKDLLAVAKVGTHDNFFELGGNSLLALRFIALLRDKYGLKLPVPKLYQYPRIKDIVAFLEGKAVTIPVRRSVKHADADIAIIGMAGRFPGADDISSFWENLKAGKETTRFFEDHELDATVSASQKNNPAYVKARGVLTNVKGFDAAFFGITPVSAQLMDPQQRIFLEIAWEALENSGYASQQALRVTGVFAGVRSNTYYANNVVSNTELVEKAGTFQVMTLNDKDYVASRTAYALDLKGPAVNVQSACSTSLLAIAQAVQSIRSGQCDMALAGGATINAPVNIGHLYEEGAMLSSDGHCRPFDADATGTVFSDGAGVVVLKNKEQALRDGDTIYAVIKGIGLSNDGGGKGSFTAPSAEGQAAAIAMAIDDAGVSAGDIAYVEAHGTATPLGDPIEISGLKMAFGEHGKKQYCAIGSVKSNFGHLTAASGVAGLIKACLALYHKQIPPTINYFKPNPHLDLEDSPFFINTQTINWPKNAKHIAGVSSFGVGGTNVHVILESGNDALIAETTTSRPVQLLCWSAKSTQSLNAYGDRLASYLKGANDAHLANTAYTLQTTRKNFNNRRFIIVQNANEFVEKQDHSSFSTGLVKDSAGNIVFMFPGQGAQFLNMGKGLYQTEPVFRAAMDECAAILMDILKLDLLDIIYPEVEDEAAEKLLIQTAHSQPALFSIGYALGKLYMSWGIFPAAFIGHSVGEFVSAYFAGVFSLADGLKLVTSRGQIMGSVAPGSMLSVRCSVDEIQPYLSDEIALAAVNSPKLCVIAGEVEAVVKLNNTLTSNGLLTRLLPTSHAFHSHMMDAVVPSFEEVVKTIELSSPLIPVASTVTGEFLTADEAISPNYWASHLRATVQYSKAVQRLLDDEYTLFLELGPGSSSSTLTRQQAAGKVEVIAISTLEKADEEQSCKLAINALGQLWLHGADVDWASFYKNETRLKLTDVPTYAFNKQDYWVEPVRLNTTLTNINTAVQPTYTEKQSNTTPVMRKQELITRLKLTLENASGIEMHAATPEMSFIELGLDSLILTQVAMIIKKEFALPVTFRQLNEELGTLDLLAAYLDAHMPVNAYPQQAAMHNSSSQASAVNALTSNGDALTIISQQLQQLAAQVAQLQGQPYQAATPRHYANNTTVLLPSAQSPTAQPELTAEEAVEIKKPFGAIARIEKRSEALNEDQQQYLADLVKRYNEKTKSSKAYTQQHRARMADPRVVSGFKPATKELVYSVVIKRSKGSRLWDLDGNEYIDALNGFGSSMLGYQPDVVKNALLEQVELGYEIGPQHELAGEVCDLVCEFTGFDRAGLCNTGSEAVVGAMRIARTVTGRSVIVAFAGSYHGINDEVIVRGSKKLKTYPAAPGIMPEAVQNMLILDYGTDEALKIIEERSHEIAAVLVEPVQSRRADFQPVDFLRKLRKLTEDTETILIFDEVISGFRFHPAGVQGMFGIKADIGTYGKVAGGGLSIGIIAGHKRFLDALDGGFWQYGDDSIPEVGVTYFAGTFVRHPLALATTKASLNYMKAMGPQLQENLNANTRYLADSINTICQRLKVPIFIAQFGSLWRIRFLAEYPYQELFFTLMRYKGIHILEGFPCYMTTAHSKADIEKIISCFEESLTELIGYNFIPSYDHPAPDKIKVLNQPPIPGARLGKDKDGNPAWFTIDEANPGKYLMINQSH
ncbi:polyketide synthase [Mucilaginibacter terrae]|uniref:Amino acid adenylation domain-containing protein n=1 Tax=Mucilaginibacter terrae TaxID=1955052 RepID=A0ABU3GMG5_9SPHI|nr:polyketide synthase [Mucilaginibacter terrae]MDT3400981.1 amino acid adenylation domain-containing protein [Mucilaginibacter terrae]